MEFIQTLVKFAIRRATSRTSDVDFDLMYAEVAELVDLPAGRQARTTERCCAKLK